MGVGRYTYIREGADQRKNTEVKTADPITKSFTIMRRAKESNVYEKLKGLQFHDGGYTAIAQWTACYKLVLAAPTKHELTYVVDVLSDAMDSGKALGALNKHEDEIRTAFLNVKSGDAVLFHLIVARYRLIVCVGESLKIPKG